MKNLWNKWKKLAEKIGNFQANLIFSLLYFLVVAPIGIVSNLFGNFLKTRGKPKWQKFGINLYNLEDMKEQ